VKIQNFQSIKKNKSEVRQIILVIRAELQYLSTNVADGIAGMVKVLVHMGSGDVQKWG
jgi:hypothetical protein